MPRFYQGRRWGEEFDDFGFWILDGEKRIYRQDALRGEGEIDDFGFWISDFGKVGTIPPWSSEFLIQWRIECEEEEIDDF